MDKRKPLPADLMNMKIDHLLDRWPSGAQAMFAHRMACVGCYFAKFHTTRQALEIYSLEAEVFLNDLAHAIELHSDGGLKPIGRRSKTP